MGNEDNVAIDSFYLYSELCYDENFIIEIETESVEGGENEHGLDYEDADDTQIKEEEEDAGDMQLEQLQGVSILGSSFLKPFEESKVQPIKQIEKSTKNQAQPKKKIKEKRKVEKNDENYLTEKDYVEFFAKKRKMSQINI